MLYYRDKNNVLKGEVDLSGLTARVVATNHNNSEEDNSNNSDEECEFGLFDSKGREVLLFSCDRRAVAEELVDELNEICSINFAQFILRETLRESAALTSAPTHQKSRRIPQPPSSTSPASSNQPPRVSQEGRRAVPLTGRKISTVHDLLSSGNVSEAKRLAQEFINGRFSSVDRAEYASLYASLLLADGDMEEAGKVSQAALRGFTAVRGSGNEVSDLRLLTTISNFAVTLGENSCDQLDELEKKSFELVAGIESKDGPSCFQLAGALLELGLLLYQRKKYESAEKELVRVVSICENLLRDASQSSESRTIAATMRDGCSNLAMIYMDTNRLAESESAFRRVLPLKLESLGSSHYDTIFTEYNFSKLLLRCGELNEARNLCDSAMKKYIHTYGPGHVNCQASFHLLVCILDAQTRGVVGGSTANSSNSTSSSTFQAATNPETLTKPENLVNYKEFLAALSERMSSALVDMPAQLLQEFIVHYGDYPLHVCCLLRLLQANAVHTHGWDHQDALRWGFDLSVICLELELLDEAYDNAKAVYERRQQLLPEFTVDVVAAAEQLNAVCCTCQRFEEAAAIYKYLLAFAENRYGEFSFEATEARQVLAYLDFLSLE
jgi:tetratricopeptide (TPR) repeat protein